MIALICPPDQTLVPVGEIQDSNGDPAALKITTGKVINKGTPQENIEVIRRRVASHIQQGPVTARNEDYEFIIKKYYPDLVYLKVWGEAEQTAQTGFSIDNINRAFFSFFPNTLDEAEINRIRDEIVELFANIIKPMNVTPFHAPLERSTFQVNVDGVIDRKFTIEEAENKIQEELSQIFGLFKNIRSKVNINDLNKVVESVGYFRDTQPHLNRLNRPFYVVTFTGTTEISFFNQYLYLDAVTFSGGETGKLGYVEN